METTHDTVFAWSDRYLVGHGAMDDTHREFTVLLNALLDAHDDALPHALDVLAGHLDAHFAQEEALMREYRFPAAECHAAEHARVLESVREVRSLAAGGALPVVRELALALADWFPPHTDYMDSAVSGWVMKKIANAAPVVLRRSLGSEPDSPGAERHRPPIGSQHVIAPAA